MLIYWAKSGQTEYTYDDLIKSLGYKRFSGISRVLGAVHDVFKLFMWNTGKDIPILNSLFKKEATGLPAHGFDYMEPTYTSLSDEGKKAYVSGTDLKTINWDCAYFLTQPLNFYYSFFIFVRFGINAPR